MSARRNRRGERLFWIGLAVVGAAVFIGLIVLASGSSSRPGRRDHWHARYAVVICGEPRPQFPPTGGNIHTHGDGVIHVHPQTRSESGRNANLRRFFGSAGVEFASDRILFPDGTSYRNGDRCPDGTTGTLRLVVNGRPSDAFDQYVPQDGDTIVVEFGPPGR